MANVNDDAMSLFLQTRHIDAYWDLVRSTVHEVFEGAGGGALDALKEEITRSPLVEQVLFYHADPLSVARAVAGAGALPLEDWQYRAYARLREHSAFAAVEVPVGADWMAT